jgi:alginate O-acetyltransferase complex protein AlgI
VLGSRAPAAMLFNSLSFLIFFPIVTLGYFVLPHRFRWAWLLGASCLFYMAFIPHYVLILGVTIVIDYFAGLLIERAPASRKKLYLVLSIVTNVGFLAVFKYCNFIVENLNAVMALLPGTAARVPRLDIVLPIGLSFHTFQAMAYTIEVYRGNQKAEKHFGVYALYVMFYPQLVAGPIERPQNILHQLKEEHEFRYDDVTNGLKLMAWGLFQKIVVADRLATIVDPVFNHPTQYHGLALLVAAVAFTFQIYLDFAAYSDIAIGSAQVMGIRLMTNFRRPFYSKSISEFWTRWHISLSTWFRDYLYIPLGGNRVSRPRWYANLVLVFLVSGLWHGASWNFVIWGALHGFYLVFALVTAPLVPAVLKDNSRLWVRVWNVGSVFVLVCFAFIFFRAATFEDAVYVIRHIPDGLVADLKWLLTSGRPLASLPRAEWGLAAAGLVAIQVVHLLQRRGSVREWLAKKPLWLRWPAYAALVYGTILLAQTGGGQFIYFQF